VRVADLAIEKLVRCKDGRSAGAVKNLGKQLARERRKVFIGRKKIVNWLWRCGYRSLVSAAAH
jgi:hypothetical protein